MAKAYATSSDLTTLFAELTSVAAALVDHYIALTTTMIQLDVWGEQSSFAHLHLAAHMIASHPGVSVAGAGPQVTSRSAGEISTSYAVAQPSDVELGSTPYGRAYLAMRAGLFVAPVAGGMLV